MARTVRGNISISLRCRHCLGKLRQYRRYIGFGYTHCEYAKSRNRDTNSAFIVVFLSEYSLDPGEDRECTTWRDLEERDTF